MFEAATNGHSDVLSVLLEHLDAVDPGWLDRDDGSDDGYGHFDDFEVRLLITAVRCGHASVVELLLTRVDVAEIESVDLLEEAAQLHHPHIVQLLLAAEGIDALWGDDRSCPALSTAVELGHLACVKLLAADARIRRFCSWDVAAVAARHGQTAVLQ